MSTVNKIHESTPVISPVKWQEGSDYLQGLRDHRKIRSHLPPGWSMHRTPEGRLYYLDHNKRGVSWRYPVHNVKHAFSATWKGSLTNIADNHGEKLGIPAFQQKKAMDNRIQVVDQTTSHRSRQQHGVQKRYRSLSELSRGSRADTATELLPLPSGWTIWKDPDLLYPIFVNPNTRIVQWYHPQAHRIWEVDKTPACSITGAGTSIVCKLSAFAYLCRSNKTYGKLEIAVEGKHALLAESYEQIMRIPGYELRKELVVSFRDNDHENPQVDGVVREWFCLMFRELCDPGYGILQSAKGSECGWELFSGHCVDSDHLKRFKFLGRFIAMILYYGKPVDLGFGPTLMFYKRLLKRENVVENPGRLAIPNLSFSEMDNGSSQLSQNQPRKNWGTSLVSFFSTIKNRFNQGSDPTKEKFSIPDKVKLDVGVHHDCSKILKERWQAVLDGFNDVIPEQWLHYFNQYDLQLLVCGVQNIDIGTWQRLTMSMYTDCAVTNKQIEWFWQFVKALDNERRSRLLQFCLGICAFPTEWKGTLPLPTFSIEMAESGAKSSFSRNPRRVLYLAPYETYRLLVEDLTELIEGTEAVTYK